MTRKLIAILIFAALVVLSVPVLAADDAIVGCWKMDSEYGNYSYIIRAYTSGKASKALFGEQTEGTWKNAKDGTYKITPSGSSDYYRIRSGSLQSFDEEGLIRTFSRTSCR